MEQLLPYVETVGSMLVTLQGNYSKNKSLIWLLLLTCCGYGTMIR